MRFPSLRRPLAAGAALLATVSLAPASAFDLLAPAAQDPAQDPERASAPEPAPEQALVLRGAKVIVRPGEVLENASVVVRGGRIVAVEAGPVTIEGARVIEGAVVCAGFIDPWSTLGVDQASVADGRTDGATRSTDALDPWGDAHARSEAAAAGVLLVRAQAGDSSSIGGLGAVVRNGVGGEHLVVQHEALVATTVGLSDGRRPKDPFDRVGEADRLVSKLEGGRDYRADWLEYRDELAKWEVEIAEAESKLEKDFKKAKKARDKEVEKAKEDGEEVKEKKYKEDKKPKEPRFDSEKEVFARVVDGELPLVVRCEGAAELRALLLGTAAFPRLRMIVAGGSGAPLLARELSKRRIPVIVQPTPFADVDSSRPEGHDLGLAGRLADHGVRVLLGSGGNASRDLPLLAALAVGHGLDAEAAFAALTEGAARALDLADLVGTVEVGKHAELLVLDGDPLTSGARVRAAISAGKVVHAAVAR